MSDKRWRQLMWKADVTEVIETERGWFAIIEAPSVVDGNVADVYGETEDDARELGRLVALAMRCLFQRPRRPTELTLDEELGLEPHYAADGVRNDATLPEHLKAPDSK